MLKVYFQKNDTVYRKKKRRRTDQLEGRYQKVAGAGIY